MDQADLMRAQQLWSNYMLTRAALDNFNNGGRIVMMQVTAGPPNPEQPVPVTMVPTQDIDYPPQMVEGIKQVLQARCDAVVKELAALGITGMENAHQARGPEPQTPPQTRSAPRAGGKGK